MYGSSRYLRRLPLGGSQQPQQSPQHLRHEKHEQQHESPQQQHRMTHQTTEMMIKPPMIMSAMTGHLCVLSTPRQRRQERKGKHTCNKRPPCNCPS
jgi:hypothetical protein